jgi:uncharacterized protein (TIGR00255 family)
MATAFATEDRPENSVAADERIRADLARLLQERLVRGRVEATATLLAAGDGEGRLEIRDAVAAQYVEAARRLARRHRLGPAFPAAALLSLPGVVQMTGTLAADPARATELLRTAFAAALEAFDAGRRAEGTRLSADLRARLEAMERDVAVITSDTAREPDRLAARLRERLAPLLQDAAIDPARLAQEVALLADKVDISEELVRLGGYLDQARGLLEGRESPAGKMLDFVMQEMNRESNTIASKSNDVAMTHAVIIIKEEIERLREQVQNVE